MGLHAPGPHFSHLNNASWSKGFQKALLSIKELEPCNPEAPGLLPSPGALPRSLVSCSGSPPLKPNPLNLLMMTDGLPNQCGHTAKPRGEADVSKFTPYLNSDQPASSSACEQ